MIFMLLSSILKSIMSLSLLSLVNNTALFPTPQNNSSNLPYIPILILPNFHTLTPNSPPPAYNQGGFDPDDMELDIDQSSIPSPGGPSHPDTPLTTPLSSHPSHSFPHLGHSGKDTVSAFDMTTILTCSIHSHSMAAFPLSHNSLSNNPEPFNGYVGYSDYSSSMPCTVPSTPVQ